MEREEKSENIRLYKSVLKKFLKEITKVPKNLQTIVKNAAEREPRFHHRVYEKRICIDGVSISATSSDYEQCRILFMERLMDFLAQRADRSQTKNTKGTSPASVSFSGFAEAWFENVHKKKVIPNTFYSDLTAFRKHVIPYFGDRALRSITTANCMDFTLHMAETGHFRCAEQCDGLLRQVFKYAVNSELIRKDPMATLKRVKSERENGVPLSKDEERAFLRAIEGTTYELMFVVCLYTGVRPCEVSTIRIDGEFIVAQNRKQKNQKRVVYKKIPITPMLRPYLPKLREALPHWDKLTSRSDSHYRDVFNRYCPGKHTPYDLRTTFATRCQECGVSVQVVQEWLGHVPDTLLGRVYTKFSDEYLLSEGKKVKY